MKRAPEDQKPDRVVHAAYGCELCRAVAGKLELKIYDDADEATLTMDGIVNRTTTWVESSAIAYVGAVIETGSARELFALNNEWASFYCPDCDRVYCRAHWYLETIFEDDKTLPAWYDCTYGTCPRDHRRIVDD